MDKESRLKAIYDVSFAGSTVVIDGVTITDFIDDANPLDIQDTETSSVKWSCNGRMIRTSKPTGVIISVTVIPGSDSDNKLREIWKRSYVNGGEMNVGAANTPLKCIISSGNGKIGKFSFTNGTCVSGAAAITSNGQGKMGGNTYTFMFERVA